MRVRNGGAIPVCRMRNCTESEFQRADLGRGLAPVAIEDAHAIAWLEAQHAPRVVCFGTSERGERPLVRREMKNGA